MNVIGSSRNRAMKLQVSNPVVSYEGKLIVFYKSSFEFLSKNTPIKDFEYCQVLIDSENSQFKDCLWLRPCNKEDFGARKLCPSSYNKFISFSSKGLNIKKPSVGTKFFYNLSWDEKFGALCAKFSTSI